MFAVWEGENNFHVHSHRWTMRYGVPVFSMSMSTTNAVLIADGQVWCVFCTGNGLFEYSPASCGEGGFNFDTSKRCEAATG